MAYLHAMSRDKGIVLMGGDPREFEPYTGEEDDDDNPTKPVRNNAEA